MTALNKGDEYRGFTVLDVVPVEDCNSTGVWLRHGRTGMEVFHLLNGDEENLFAFAFRTPVSDSCGTPHVLEHSVLCGSDKYPLRDPFIRLSNQSVNTYLNAYTAADHTVFPASSIVRADYFNLLSVYADAVFFPLLRPEIFMQECHRLELDARGRPSIQGVVYNEMKGSYSSYEDVASDEIDRAVLIGTGYEYDAGGDPLEIPRLTLARLRAFHKKYYCPANCMVFLYGDIPTQEQLDFLDANVLVRFPNGGRRAPVPAARVLPPPQPFVRASGPADENTAKGKCTVALSWRVDGDAQPRALTCMEVMFLGELLWGDDCAPVSKALLASSLGEDIAPQTGENIALCTPLMTFALRGVDAKNARRVEALVMDALRTIRRDGFARADLDRTCMTFDLSNREIRRFDGPYSLVLLRRCLRGWQYGEAPWSTLLSRSQFAAIKERLASDGSYLQSLVGRYLLDNPVRSLVTVRPSAAWSRRRALQEKKNAEEALARTSVEKVGRDLKKMYDFQNREPTKDEDELIPRLRVQDLGTKVEAIRTKVTQVQGVPLLVNTEPTNGIVYVDVAYPADTLPPGDYPLLPSLAEAAPQMGWGGQRWDAALARMQAVAGSFGAYVRTSAVPDCAREAVKDKPYAGRDWVVFHFKALEENVAAAFSLLADCLTGIDFSDLDRLKDLVTAQANSASATVVPAAHWYAAYRASRLVNRTAAVNEIWEGLSAVFTLKELAKMGVGQLASRYRNIFSRLQKGGGVIHLTATRTGVSRVKKILPDFIARTSFAPPAPGYGSPDSEFYALTELPGERGGSRQPLVDEVVLVPGTVGFDGCAVESAPFDTKACMADEVYTHYLTNTDLWKQIRTAGGAYGVYMTPNSDSNFTRFITFRDPKPFDSLRVVRLLLEEAARKDFSVEEVEKAVTGCFSDEVTPRTPSGKGATGFLWALYGLTNAQKSRRIRWLLGIRPEDVRAAAARYAAGIGRGRTVIVCGKDVASASDLQQAALVVKLPV